MVAAREIPPWSSTDPEIAWCGLSEREAKEQKIRSKFTSFPGLLPGSHCQRRTDGVTKLIVEPKTQQHLGMGIAGAGAGEMIAEGVLAVEMAAVARDLAESIHAHPTLSETLMESAELVLGSATHISKPKRRE